MNVDNKYIHAVISDSTGQKWYYCEACSMTDDKPELIDHDDDCVAVEATRLRAVIAGLRCVTNAAPYRDCIEVKAVLRPDWKECQVCRAKREAGLA